MPWGINDGDIVLGGLKLPQSNINGDATFTLGLELVQYPSILEGTFPRLLRLLLELLNGPLVNSSALVDEVARGGGLARVHVANHYDVHVGLFLAHVAALERAEYWESEQARGY